MLTEVLSEPRFRALIEHSADAIALITRDGIVFYASPSTKRVTGYTVEEFVGIDGFGLVHPDDVEHMRVLLERILSQPGAFATAEFRFCCKDGLFRWMEGTATNWLEEPTIGAIVVNYRDITERKEQQQALRVSEEALHVALKHSPITVYQQDRDLRYTWIYNPLIAFTPDGIIGKTDADFLSAEEAAHLTALKQRVLTSGESIQEEIQTNSAAGRHTIALTVEPLRDSQKKIIGVTGAAIDVTERHQLEQYTRSVMEAVLEMAQVMVQGATRDADSAVPTVVRLRPVMQRMAELTRTVLGCKRLSFTYVEPETELLRPLAVVGLSPEQEAQWWQEQEQQEVHLSDGPDLSLVEQLRANETLYLDLTKPPYRDQPNPYGILQMLVAPMVFGSRLLGFLSLDYGGLEHSYTSEELALTKAVTELAAQVMERERLLAERIAAQADAIAWRTAHQRMVELIDLAHDAVIVRDPASRIVYWNSGAERLYGWNAFEAYGQSTHVLLATRFPISQQSVELQLLDRGQWEGILTHTSRAGKLVIVESRQVLVRGEDGEPESVLEINRDITERERIQQEREEARANEMAAQEAARRMDEFIGVASHELRTPLTSIKGNLQLAQRRVNALLQEASASDESMQSKLSNIRMMLDRAERQVGIQNRLVSDLVDVSRIRTGKLELHQKMSDLATIVREAVEDSRLAAPTRSISFETSALTIPVLVDSDRIEQVVSNYLSNALKYSLEDRPVAVRIVVHEKQVQVAVRDEGPGLTAEEQRHIWERFYRVPEIVVQSGSGVGLGLGLHICQTIIEQHGGQVGIESTKGNGSTFWFTLPLLELNAEADTQS